MFLSFSVIDFHFSEAHSKKGCVIFTSYENQRYLVENSRWNDTLHQKGVAVRSTRNTLIFDRFVLSYRASATTEPRSGYIDRRNSWIEGDAHESAAEAALMSDYRAEKPHDFIEP